MKPRFKMKSLLTWRIRTLKWNRRTRNSLRNWMREASLWSSTHASSLKSLRRLSLWKLKLTYLRRVSVKSLLTLKRSANCWNSRTSRPSGNKLKRAAISQSRLDWSTRNWRTWRLYAKWSLINVLISNNSSLRRLSRSKRKSAVSFRMSSTRSRASSCLSSYPWSNQALNSQRRTLNNRIKSPSSRVTKWTLNYLTWTGSRGKQS